MNDTLDRPLFFITVFLAMTGVVMIYSATHNAAGIGTSQYMMQSIWFGTGLIVMYLTYLLPLAVSKMFLRAAVDNHVENPIEALPLNLRLFE